MSLYRITVAAGQQAVLPPGVGAALVHQGEAAGGPAFLVAPGAPGITAASDTDLLVYLVDAAPGAGRHCLDTHPVTLPEPCLLRLDEVSFPPGAVAYRHVHPGSGYRHLRWGALWLEAEDHSFDAAPGDTWFEPAFSPVRATASEAHAETRFARFMLLPPRYQGKPTIQLLDPWDEARPKRQVTHRHVDHVLDHWP